MGANIEVDMYKDGKRVVFTVWVKKLYNGITADMYDKYSRAGYTDISIRIF